jgi:hypothetical protein
MTRKDYEAIASILRDQRDALESYDRNSYSTIKAIATLGCVEDNLIRLFESDNPRFDRERFIAKSHATRAHREAIASQLEEAI